MDHLDPVTSRTPHRPPPRRKRKGPCLRDGCESGNGSLQDSAQRQRVFLLLRRLPSQVPGRSRKDSVIATQADDDGIGAGVPRRSGCCSKTGMPTRTRRGRARRPSLHGHGSCFSVGSGSAKDTRVYVCPMCPEVRQTRAGPLSQVWNGARSRVARSPRDQDRIHLPDASRDRASGARELSDLRHGS